MAARLQRRTLSSFIEWTIEESLRKLEITDIDKNNVKFEDFIEKTFDIDPSEKLTNIALSYPILLTYDEILIWKVIETHEYFWLSFDTFKKRGAGYGIEDLDLDNIRNQWKNIIIVAGGGSDEIPARSEPCIKSKLFVPGKRKIKGPLNDS